MVKYKLNNNNLDEVSCNSQFFQKRFLVVDEMGKMEMPIGIEKYVSTKWRRTLPLVLSCNTTQFSLLIPTPTDKKKTFAVLTKIAVFKIKVYIYEEQLRYHYTHH